MSAMELINDRQKMQTFLASMSPRSISNAGRNIEMSSGNAASRAHALEGSSITAAEQHRALQHQTARQLAFALPPSDGDRVTSALPSLDVLAIIDAQRLACESNHHFADEPVAAVSSNDAASPSRLVRDNVQLQSGGVKGQQQPSLLKAASDDAASVVSDTLRAANARSPKHQLEGTASALSPLSPAQKKNLKGDEQPLKFLSQLSARRVQQPAKPSPCFLARERQTSDVGTTGMPPVGHYRPKHALTEPVLSGGYIEPRPVKHSPKRPRHGGDQQEPAVPTLGSPTASSVGSPTKTLQSGASSARLRAREKLTASPPRGPHPDPVFQSKAPRLAEPYPTDGADAWYWPRCDWRSDPTNSHRVDLAKVTPRKELHTIPDNPDAYYNITSPLGANVVRTSDLSLLTGREHYPVEKKFFYQKDVDIISDPQKLLDHVRPHVGSMIQLDRHLARPPFGPTEPYDCTVDHRDGASPKDVSSQRKRAKLITDFGRQVPHPPLPSPGSKGAPELYDVSTQLTYRSPPRAVIHDSSPGHLPLHEPSMTDFASPPSVDAVRPKITQEISLEKPSPRKPMLANLQDLEYDVKTNLMSPRVTGNPMISSTLAREKRERAFAHRTCGPDAGAYTFTLPSAGAGAHVDFSRHVARDDAACGRGNPSPKYLERHPRAPGPGSYDVK